MSEDNPETPADDHLDCPEWDEYDAVRKVNEAIVAKLRGYGMPDDEMTGPIIMVRLEGLINTILGENTPERWAYEAEMQKELHDHFLSTTLEAAESMIAQAELMKGLPPTPQPGGLFLPGKG